MLPLSESHSVPNPTSAMQRTENYHLWKLQKVHHCVPYLSARKLLRWIVQFERGGMKKEILLI